MESIFRMSGCTTEQQVPYVTELFQYGARLWWNLQVRIMGLTSAYALTWDELKGIMRKKYCAQTETQRLEGEFQSLIMEGPKMLEFMQRLHDLARVVPYLVEPELRKLRHFIWELAPQVLSLMTASTPPTTMAASKMGLALVTEVIRLEKLAKPDKETHVESSGGNKRKFSNFKQGTSGVVKKGESSAPAQVTAGSGKKGKGYMGTQPKCNTCQRHHSGRCSLKVCEACGKPGHLKDSCWKQKHQPGRKWKSPTREQWR
ncbi:putative transcription factor interactor and regulator CCHC(Zn) family [Helianthus annuus]|nr:putative transcription factor interactor and regulator CCHC(Zn) family [Helianthus annuus]